MRIAGRNDLGSARPLRLDKDDALYTRQQGSNVILHENNGTQQVEVGAELSVMLDILSPYVNLAFLGSVRTTTDDYSVIFNHCNKSGGLIYSENVDISVSESLSRGYFTKTVATKGAKIEVVIKNNSNVVRDVVRLTVIGKEASEKVRQRHPVISYEKVSEANAGDHTAYYYGENSVSLPNTDEFNPFNISESEDNMIYFKNDTNKDMFIRLCFYHKVHRINPGDFIVRGRVISVPSNSGLLINATGEPMLKEPFQGMSAMIYSPAGTTGNYTIRMFRRV